MNFLQEVILYQVFTDSASIPKRLPNIKRYPSSITGDNRIHFRITDECKRQLTEEFHNWSGKHHATSEKRIEVFLSMMSSGGYYRQIGHIFGLAKSTVFDHTHEVVDFLFDTAGEWISLPVEEDFEVLSSNFLLTNGETRKVLLYVDGSIIRITRPDNANDSFYCGRAGKSCDSLNSQFVVDKFGNVRHVVTGLSGRLFSVLQFYFNIFKV